MRLFLGLLLSCALMPPHAAAQTAKRPASPAATTLTLSVTDGRGAPVEGARVTATGPVARDAPTDANGSLRLQGLTSGTYRFRFEREGYITLERDVTIPARQPAMAQNVMLSDAPEPPPSPPEPEPDPAPAFVLPPPGELLTLDVPDFIERNFIASNQPQKASAIGCSGVANTVLWQIREPWEDRRHEAADALLYVVGGEGTLRVGSRNLTVRAGSLASVPRETTYALTRRGRNPLIVLAMLAGEPCQ